MTWLQDTGRFFSFRGGSNSYLKGHFGDLSWFVLVSFLQMSVCFIQIKIDVYVGHLPPPRWSCTLRKVDMVSRGA